MEPPIDLVILKLLEQKNKVRQTKIVVAKTITGLVLNFVEQYQAAKAGIRANKT